MLKSLFRDTKIPDECIDLIWEYSKGWGNNTLLDDVSWNLKNIILDDQKTKFDRNDGKK